MSKQIITVSREFGSGGRTGGKREAELLLDFAASLSDREFDATYYRLINIPDCPFILAFQKRR